MRKLVVALACRNQGSRLYGKPLQNLDIERGYTILDHLLGRLASSPCIAQVVLGIAEGNENVTFIDYANKNQLEYIVGDETDVLSRLIACGEKSQATDILRVTSESPFTYMDLLESAWNDHVNNENDATFLDDIIDGCNFEIIRLEALQRSHEKGTDKHRSELCTLFIRDNKQDFKIQFLSPPKHLSRKDLRFTVDYPEDLIVCRAIYECFKESAPLISLDDAVSFMDENEHLKKLTMPFCEAGYETMYL